MITATLKENIESRESGIFTYNRHFLEKKTVYEVLSEQSGVTGFPYILIHPKLKNILLVAPPGINVMGAL